MHTCTCQLGGWAFFYTQGENENPWAFLHQKKNPWAFLAPKENPRAFLEKLLPGGVSQYGVQGAQDVHAIIFAKTDGWLLHAVVARCIFGPKSHNIDEYTRERTENRYTGEDVTKYSFSAEDRYSTHGIINVITQEQNLDNPEDSYDDLAQETYFPTSGFSDQYVTRLGLGEIRVLTLHINSDAFRNAISKIRQYLRLIFAKALLAQVDFITGDFNLFCNRQFLSDLGGSVYGGLVMEVLDDAVRRLNRIFEHPVTYNVSSSTPASELFDFMEHGNTNAEMDCMLCISLFYNKQRCEERPPKLITQREIAHDYLHSISERPRQLSNYDMCLGQTDCDWHLPLIVRVHAHHLRNKRTRSTASQQSRQAAAQRRQVMAETPAGMNKNDGTLVHMHVVIIQDGTVEIINRQYGCFYQECFTLPIQR